MFRSILSEISPEKFIQKNNNHTNYFRIHRIDVNDDRTNTLSAELQNLCQKNLQMVMVAVGNNSADRYSAIKKVHYYSKEFKKINYNIYSLNFIFINVIFIYMF